MKIELKIPYKKGNVVLNTKKDNGEITITSSGSHYAGLWSYYENIVIQTDAETFEYDERCTGIGSEYNGSLGQYYLSKMLEENIDAQLREGIVAENGYKYVIKFKKPSAKKEKIIKALKKLPSTKSGLRFCKFAKITDDVIVVEYYGHEVGGSYVHDYEVAPGYIKKLSVETNRKVTWEGRRNGGIGSDIYEFKIRLSDIIDEKIEKRVVTGKMFHIDGCYSSRSCPGEEWSSMFAIAKGFQDGEMMRGFKQEKGNIISFEDQALFKVHEQPVENSSERGTKGTHYLGVFEMLVSSKQLLEAYLKGYGLNNACTAELSRPMHSGSQIRKTMRDGSIMNVELGYI